MRKVIKILVVISIIVLNINVVHSEGNEIEKTALEYISMRFNEVDTYKEHEDKVKALDDIELKVNRIKNDEKKEEIYKKVDSKRKDVEKVRSEEICLLMS